MNHDSHLHQGDIHDLRKYTLNVHLPAGGTIPSIAEIKRLKALWADSEREARHIKLRIMSNHQNSASSQVQEGFEYAECNQMATRSSPSETTKASAAYSLNYKPQYPSQAMQALHRRSTLSGQVLDTMVVKSFIALAVALIAAISQGSTSITEIQHALQKLQTLLIHIQSRDTSIFLPTLFACICSMLIQRMLFVRSISGTTEDIFIFEDAFSTHKNVPLAYLESTEIFEGFLFSHYKGSLVMSFLQQQQYSVTAGSRDGPSLDLSTIKRSRRAGKALVLIMAVTYVNDLAVCPDCTSKLFNGNGSVYIWYVNTSTDLIWLHGSMTDKKSVAILAVESFIQEHKSGRTSLC